MPGSAYEIVRTLNEIGGRNGIGRVDMVENRFVGMKSRGVYESPGMTILYESLRLLEQLTLDRELMHLRDRLAPEVAEMVYYGFWYTTKMDALLAVIRQAQRTVTGEVALNLYKGNIVVDGRSSPCSLYDEGIAGSSEPSALAGSQSSLVPLQRSTVLPVLSEHTSAPAVQLLVPS